MKRANVIDQLKKKNMKLFLLFVIPLVIAEECKNKFQTCWNLDSAQCFGDGREWMKENCAAKCGYCKDTSMTCADKTETCKEIPQICTIPEYEGWVRTNCRKFCGLCFDNAITKPETSITPGIKNPQSDCYDKRDDCYWMDDSMCFNSVIVDYCPKRCGKCEGEKNNCSDAIDYCHKLEKDMCTRTENQGWARMNCRKFCNLCAAPTTTTVEPTTTPVPYIPDPSPTDGKWSYWDSWSQCTATCGSGTRTRQRKCNSPPPLNGGRNCTGISQESESCNMFECPDCDRVCPWGGHLSKDCSMCVCSNTIIFGTIRDENNHPIDGVDVFLDIKQWEPFAKTDAFGRYVAKEICLMGEDILFKKKKYNSVIGQPTIMNRTHWVLDATLQSLATPKIQIHPKDKARMEGQSVTLCCKAVGRPQPTKYTWTKNGEEISGGLNGNLYLGNLKTNNSGKYTCRVETVAGTAFSREADLTVHDLSQDSCNGIPEENQVDLPEGCHYERDGILFTTVNLNQCKKGLCVKSAMRNTGSCEDPWGRHCCSPKAVEVIDIQCVGFSYQMNRIISCQCSSCETLTQISGSAYGIQNGSKIPYSYGEIYIGKQQVALTSSMGYFTFSFEPNTTSVVIELKNDRDRKFMSTLKTVEITEDQNTPVEIVVPLKPKPLQFHSNEGVPSIPLGSIDNDPPAIHMSIPKNSILKKDGTPYDGLANVSVHFMDPRNLDDLKSAYGSLTYVDEHGNSVPLDTYGMFEVNIEDHQGNELLMNSPVKVEMDTSVMNVSVDENGNPDLYSWYLDPGTGMWVELEQAKFKSAPVGNRRRLLQDKSVIEGFFPPSVDDIDIIDRARLKYNLDKKAKSFYELNYREAANKERLNSEACVVRIKVYQDTTFKKVLKGSGVTVTAYTKNGNKYTGSYSKQISEDGVACLYILCHQDVQIHAKQASDPVDLVASSKHSLPPGMSFSNLQRHRIVSFNARVNGYQPIFKKFGPVFQFLEKGKCAWRQYLSADKDDYHFQFAPLVKSPIVNIKEKDKTDKPLSWYPAEKDKQTRRSCFIKVIVLGNESVLGSVRVQATSYQNGSFSNALSYGSIEVGALPDLSKNNTVNFGELGACLEVRCPGQIKNGSTIIDDIPTSVRVRLAYNATSCRPSPNGLLSKRAYRRYLIPFPEKNSFELMLSPVDNYGPVTGVYVYNGVSDTVKNFCLSGRDTDPVSNTMKIDQKTAAYTFDCR